VMMAIKTPSGAAGNTRTGRWGGNVAMAGQITLCFVLLVAAGLLLRSLRNFENTDLGMRTQGLLVFGLTPQETAGNAKTLLFYRNLLDRVRTLPGIDSATVLQLRLGGGWSNNNDVVVDGVHHDFNEVPLRSNTVGPDFFHVLGVPVLRGRDITDADTETSQRVVVVNETFVKKLLPNTDPLGHRVGSGKNPYIIVGVAKDSKYTRVAESERAMAYYPYTQAGGVGHLDVEVRTEGDPLALLPSIRRAVGAFDPNLPLEDPQTQQAVFEHSYQWQELLARLSSFFGFLAAFLVAIGLYGTLAYRVSRRHAEIGVRMALGAARGHVLWMVLRESLMIMALGLAAGLPLTLLSGGVMSSMLYQLQPRDPVTLGVALVVVLLVTLAASLLPARKAASVEPMEALRTE
jgi:predicted permease